MTQDEPLNFFDTLRLEAQAIGCDEADLPRALSLLDRGAKAADAIADPVARDLATALLWRGRAIVLQCHHCFAESLKASQQAIMIYEHHNRPYEIALARTIDVYVLGMLERFEEAIALAAWVEPQFVAHDFKLGQAHLAANLARIYLHTYRLNEALERYQTALGHYQELGMLDQVALMRHDLGVTTQRMDQLDLAAERYNQAYPAFVAANNRFMMIKTKFNLAQICVRQGAYEAALDHLAQGRDDLTQTTQAIDTMIDTADLAYLDLFEAEVRQALGERAAAQDHLLEALDHFKRFEGHQTDIIQTLLKLAQLVVVEGRSNKLSQGLAYLRQAEARLQPEMMPLLTAWVHLAQGNLLLQLKQTTVAAEWAEMALTIFSEANLPLRRAQAEVLLGRCWRLQPERAQSLYRTALAACGETIPWLAADCWRGLARLAQAADDPAAAVQAYEEAITRLNTMRRSLRSHQHQAGFFEDKQTLVDELLAALSRPGGDTYRLLGWVERFKAGALADLLLTQPPDSQTYLDLRHLLAERTQLYQTLDQHQSQLTLSGSTEMAAGPQRGLELPAHDAYQAQELATLRQQLRRIEAQISRQRDPAQAWREGATLNPHLIHHLLDAETVCLSYYTAEGQLYALTGTYEAGDLERHPLKVSLAEIERRWTHTRRQIIRSDNPISGVQKRLAALWKHLIAPLVPRLADKKRLLILPYRGLFHLPFGALYDPHTQQYLFERWTVQLAPSLTILAHCQQLPKGTQPPLLVGSPSYLDQPDYLPAVEAEIQALQQLLPQAETRLGAAATLADMISDLTDRSVVHLAGHAIYDGANPLESGLQLAGGRWLRAADLYLQHGQLKGATVVLSGCDSGRGRSTGGEILGLTSAFLYAGAASLVTGLWRIDDAATADLMTAFYRYLVNGADSAQALQAAQLDLLHSQAYAAPYYWVPFTLNGDCRLVA